MINSKLTTIEIECTEKIDQLFNILYIDDNEELLKSSQLFFNRNKRCNMDICKPKTYKDIYLKLHEKNYNIIILDYTIPELLPLNGIDIAQNLRNNNIFTPIIIYTAETSLFEFKNVFRNELNFVNKDWGIISLLSAVNKILKDNSN